MRNGILVAVLFIVAGNNLVHAQVPSPTTLPAVDAGGASRTNGDTIVQSPADGGVVFPAPGVFSERPATGLRFWASAEYLLWWSTQPNLPPLVTGGNLADQFPGALGQPGTNVLFGGQQNYGAMNGLRLTVGGWLNRNPCWGWEVNGFFFEQQTSSFSTASDAQGNPPTYFPIYRPDVNREGVIRISNPINNLVGSVDIGTASRLWGMEANGLFKLRDMGCWHVALIGGFRYLDLQESVTIGAVFDDPLFDIHRTIGESFTTRSQFYGGQVGAKVGSQWGKFSADFTGKLALGVTRQVVNIQGSDTISGAGAGGGGTFAEGIYAQTSNIGQQTASNFAVIPQGQVKVGYDLCRFARATFGYEFLYWSSVVRAGDQIDRRVDVTQAKSFGGSGAAVAFPEAQINRSGYWAHGVTFGLEFRY